MEVNNGIYFCMGFHEIVESKFQQLRAISERKKHRMSLAISTMAVELQSGICMSRSTRPLPA